MLKKSRVPLFILILSTLFTWPFQAQNPEAKAENASSNSGNSGETAPVETVSLPASVTVYPDRALVTRAARVKMERGRRSVKVVRLPFDLVKESVRVAVESAARVKILSTDLSTNYELRTPEKEIAILQKQLEELKEKREALADRIKNLENEKRLLESIEVKNITDKNKEIAINKLAFDEWGKLLDFYVSNSSRIDSARRETMRRLVEVKEKITSVENQIGQGRSQKTGTNEVLVTLESDKEAEMTVKVSYLIQNASWRPFYEIRTDDGKTVELQYMAAIRQNTGEDWNNVEITLTTARPALGIDIAPAQPIMVYRKYPQYNAGKSEAKRSARSKAAMEDRAAANEAVEAETMEEKPAEYETTGVQQDFASASFKIAKKSDIAGDNSDHNVMIVREKINSDVGYKLIAYANENVFMSGKIKNDMEYALLPGKVNLFINNNYAGSAALKMTAPQETFSLPFGPDEKIKAKYTKVKESTDTYGLGKKRKKTTYEYKIEIENLKNTAVTVDVNDRIPVSSDTEIKVDLREASPKNDNDPQADRGILLWHLPLNGKEKKTIRFTYTVDYPEDYMISF